ncbi:conserved hypothetical protein [Pseudarthrobacter chlorophenolicus A6]|uniref:Uncharacterized protein n=1 Tax=Pseudarthrobacter chlorophenolicus (strain ATCC 700700 / DSM 12829 / CIP 107037 / JCM 12360 / KCTC 9906 / NCIMB 13794 / A6) TaxID=452863 RepID=B8HCM9_PSECP|nr:hypothetical protein [Pseudarthrobacter chlorophenolicus]ACL38812.1 conserved hypothetical protein [Pseudarthrobacter chlorophenolicus A6]SDR08417.1 hypothetical protein SAMN04489738_4722 [Pseudarthrobacter chlorophenolicus]
MADHTGPAAAGQESWRDSVPEDTAADLENLLGTGVSAAQEQLQRAGGFLPFALTVQNDGEVRLVAVSPADAEEGSGAEFDADAMISDLNALLKQNRDDYRAAALVCDILLVEEDSDAIHVAAEHRDGSVFAAVLPYAANADTQTWEFGELEADTNEPAIWVD